MTKGQRGRRTPFFLSRYPRLLAALMLGALLLALAVAAYPLFLSATSSSLVRAELERPLAGRYAAGVAYRVDRELLLEPGPAGDGLLYLERDERFRELAGESEQLGEPVFGVLGPEVTVAPTDDRATPTRGRLLGSTGALEHVHLLRGEPGGGGAWLPDVIAGALKVGPGDEVALQSQAGGSVRIPVEGVYRDLYSRARVSYWGQWADEIYVTRAGASVPPQPILLPPEDVVRLSGELGVEDGAFSWQAPLRADARLTLDDARRLATFARTFRARLGDESPTGRLFDCCDEGGGPFQIGHAARFFTRIHSMVAAAEERTAAVEAPGRVVQGAGIAVAAAVLAAAGAFAVGARVTEHRLLFVRGVSPGAVGRRTAAEALAPALAGSAAGFGLALALVGWLGPDGGLASSAVGAAAVGTAVAALVAVAGLGLVAGASYVGRFEHRGGRLGWLARLPWELAALGLAIFSLGRLQDAAAGGVEGARPGILLLVFPLALMAAASGLAARGLRAGFRAVRARVGRLGTPTYLAARRLAAASHLAVVLVAGAGLCFGLLVQTRSLVTSLRETVDVKAKTFVGSDAQAWVGPSTEPPADFPLPVTRVTRIAHAGTLTGTGTEVDVLAIDPATFARAAFWDDSFADAPLEDLVSGLDRPGLPAILAGDVPPSVSAIDINQETLSLDEVGRALSFPGILGNRALLVVDGGALDEAYEGTADPRSGAGAVTELWVRGEPLEVEAALTSLRFPPFSILTAEEVADIPYITATVDTFVVLNALALAAAVLVAAGLLMYLEARQRSQLVAQGLTGRMGMSARSQRRALTIEIATMLLVALAVGTGVGIVAAYVMTRFVDPLGSIPPEPVFLVSTPLVAVTTAAVVAVALLGARATERRVRRVSFAEVMRVADD